MKLIFTKQYCAGLILICFITLFFSEFAMAGPGGVIKEASKTLWGKIIMLALILFFAPLIAWYSLKRRILVNRTRKLLQQIAQSDPRFEWMELKDRFTRVFYWVHSAWDQKKMSLAEGYVTDWYIKNQQFLLDKWEKQGLENVVSQVKIKSMTPLYFAQNVKNDDNNRFTVEIVAEMRDYMIDKQSSRVVEGDKTLGEVSAIWSFTRENGHWVLNLIEADDMSMDYLTQKDKIYAAEDGVAV